MLVKLQLLARLAVLLVLPVMLLSSCTPEAPASPTLTPEPKPTPTQPPSSTPSPTDIPTPTAPPTSKFPLNVTLNYVGVKSNQATTGTANIYLLLVITDGYQKATSRFLPAGANFSLNSYQVIPLNQMVFHTDSAGDSLKVCILAYKQNDPRWLSSILTPALAEIERGLSWGDYRSAQEILTTVEKYKQKSPVSFTDGGDKLLGYYEDVWGTNESRGIGEYNAVGSDDFWLWFSIWSKEQPKPASAPVLLPEVTLDNVNLVSSVNTGQRRVDIVRIKNKELHPITVSLKGTSLLSGDFYSNAIEVPADGYAWVEKEFVTNSAGIDTITYTIYFQNIKLDSESKELRVSVSGRQIALIEWRNADISARVERVMDNSPVTLYVEAPGYDGEVLTAGIRRIEPDGSYRYEETVIMQVINGQGIAKWTAKWQPVVEGSPTYLFGVKDKYSNELTVVKRYEIPPQVKMDKVDMMSYIEAGKTRTDMITLKSSQSEPTVVRLKGYSSVEGEFYNSAVSVPGDSLATVAVESSFEKRGVRTITYKLYYQGIEFDSWSTVLEVL